MKQTMKNPILRYRIAVFLLLAALLTVALGKRQELATARSRADNAEYLVGEYKAALNRSEETGRQAQSRLDAIEQGAIIPQGTRKAIAAEVISRLVPRTLWY